MTEQPSVVRASIIVAAAALLEAVLGPYLTLGYISPKFALIAIVFAVSPLRDLQAVLLGFFGGILLDALGSGLFGVGALAGLAGLFEVAGPSGQITDSFNVGYGFAAIIVAFLGRLHPIGIGLAGLLMALTYIGGDMAQLMLGLPSAAIQVFQGMLLFFLLGFDLLTNYRIRIGRARA